MLQSILWCEPRWERSPNSIDPVFLSAGESLPCHLHPAAHLAHLERAPYYKGSLGGSKPCLQRQLPLERESAGIDLRPPPTGSPAVPIQPAPKRGPQRRALVGKQRISGVRQTKNRPPAGVNPRASHSFHPCRQRVGVVPAIRLKERLKCGRERKPTSKATSLTRRLGSCSICFARSTRKRAK